MQPKRIIIDTNIWVSYLISGKFSLFDTLIHDHKIHLIFSEELLEEFITVIQRPKFSKIISDKDITSLLQSIERFAEFISVTTNLKMSRDTNDDFLLNLAVDSKADFLITGDKDLLVLKNISKTKIITYNEFKRNYE